MNRERVSILSVASALLLSVTAAYAQAFNIDFGSPDGAGPSSAYAGVATQPGYWNLGTIGYSLKDTSGAQTDVNLGGTSAGLAHLSIPSLSGDEKIFMESVLTPGVSGNSVGFFNLSPGTYDLYIYGWGGTLLGPKSAGFDVFNGVSTVHGFVSYTSVWPGAQTRHITYDVLRVNVLEPQRLLLLDVGFTGDYGVINGMQLVPVPAPGAALPLLGLCLGFAACRRRP